MKNIRMNLTIYYYNFRRFIFCINKYFSLSSKYSHVISQNYIYFNLVVLNRFSSFISENKFHIIVRKCLNMFTSLQTKLRITATQQPQFESSRSSVTAAPTADKMWQSGWKLRWSLLQATQLPTCYRRRRQWNA